ncbi:glycosyltransferase family 4 protein [Butyrivibrio proteoclasticus]|uniref:glycosyltransferase family 4 protein n=1 Tax=Butyrivibrio proteoclasticus TaxID=43305 RepID=UPI00047B921F|nr:glycosyltransferase family 4 protein [Butyrivibrio proteoclasticus]
MRFIICGTMLHPKVEEKLPGASPAAGKYLRNLKKTLEAQGNEVIFCSYVAIPGAKQMYEQLGLDDNDLVYKDKTIVKSIHIFQNKLLDLLHEDDVVILYNVPYFELGLISKIKKRGNRAVLILADHTDSFKENGGVVRGIIAKLISRDYRKFDYGIALSEYAKRFFSSSAKLIVMEGGVDLERYKDFEPPVKSGVTKFMYAGTLSDVTGVDILLDAIEKWHEDDVEFYISGKGYLEERVRKTAEKDNRIKYLGFVPDDEYYSLMKEIDVFLNPRNMDMEQNQNNFPSKVLEYLATGRCVVSSKFPGWEKFRDLFIFYDRGDRDLLDKLLKAKNLNNTELCRIYCTNRKRAEEYDWNKQVVNIMKELTNSK